MDRTRIGRYQVLGQLGEGGMGVVYKAFDPLIERAVAVKVVSNALNDSADMRDRFFAEARAVGRLSHRNIVTIHDLGEEDGQPFFAMEYLEGQDLGAGIRAPEAMTLDRKLDIVSQAAEGLAYAHARGITHRDVKPANIFLTTSGQVKILDFGLARLPGSQMTRSRTLLGTINYLAPEQVRGDPADQRTDVFSLGVVLYELLTGRAPFEGGSFATTLHKILTEVPQPVTDVDPCVRPEVSAILDRALAKAPEERYQQVTEMLADLVECRRVLRGSECAPDEAEATDEDGGPSRLEPLSWPATRTPPPASRPPSGARRPASGARRPASGARRPSVGVAVASGYGIEEPPAKRSPWRGALLVVPLLLAAVVAGWWMLGATGERQAPPPEAATTSSVTAVPPTVPVPPPTVSGAAVPPGTLTPGTSGTSAPPAVGGGSAADEPKDGRGQATASGNEARRGSRGETPGPGPAQVATGRPTASGPSENAATRRSASEGLSALGKSRTAADAISARTLAAAAYLRAESVEAEGRALYGKGEFTRASQKLQEAAGLFRLAEIEARTEQLRREEADQVKARALQRATSAREAFTAARGAAVRAGAEKLAPLVFKEAGDRAGGARDLFDRSEYDQAAGAFEAAARRMEDARDEAERTAAANLAAAAKPKPPPAAAPPPPAAPGPDERAKAEAAVRDVLARYEAAFEARDLAALERIWPGMGEAQKQQIASQFTIASRLEVDLLDPRITFGDGNDSATAVARRRYRLDDSLGHRNEVVTTSRFTLRRRENGWVIQSFETIQ